MFKEFKEFALRGSVVDMAVGIIIGGALGTIARSLVDDIVMPPIGLVLSGIDPSNWFLVLKPGTPPGPYPALTDAKGAGAVTLNYGVFLNAVISFLLVAFAVFVLIRSLNPLRRRQHGSPATTKECPHCTSMIPFRANRCPLCTSQLVA